MKLNNTPILALLSLVTCLFAPFSQADDSAKPGEARPLVGWVEFVKLMPSGTITKAKLDTGAMTSSLHARYIKFFKKDGKQWVRFKFKKNRTAPIHGMPAVPKINLAIEAPVNRMVKIKQHTVDFVERPEITLPIEMGGRIYDTQFTLTDRSDFIYPVLLGRRFLAKAVYVDAARMNMTGMPPELLKSSK